MLSIQPTISWYRGEGGYGHIQWEVPLNFAANEIQHSDLRKVKIRLRVTSGDTRLERMKPTVLPKIPEKSVE